MISGVIWFIFSRFFDFSVYLTLALRARANKRKIKKSRKNKSHIGLEIMRLLVHISYIQDRFAYLINYTKLSVLRPSRRL